MYKLWITLAGILGFSAVAMAAYSAHGLINIVDPNFYEIVKNSIDTAVRQQFMHAIVLLVLGIWVKVNKPLHQPSVWINISAVIIFIGILLFAGSIYLNHLLGVSSVSILAPVGGTILLVGWLVLILAALLEYK